MPQSRSSPRGLEPGKYREPEETATGAERAFVELDRLETLWFNTGTLCNVECLRCYIDSSPTNDRLAYLTSAEVSRYLDELVELDSGTTEIGFTGGEPFMNRDLPAMLTECLARDFDALVLTNAMQPLMRSAVQRRLLHLRETHGDRLHLRVSFDHYTRELHERERGARSWAAALRGMHWLAKHGFHVSVAGRMCWNESEREIRDGYARLFAEENLTLDAQDLAALVLFPEMDEAADVPEVTVDCWGILGVEPSTMMCAGSRMVVKRRGMASPTVVSCTLLPYDPQFELGNTLREALAPVRLNHPHCAQFCVLGRASCSASS